MFIRPAVGLGAACAFVLVVTVPSLARAADYTTFYTVNLNSLVPVHHLFAVDEFANGSQRIAQLPSFSSFNNTLVNPELSDTPVSSYFLIGLYTDATAADHLFLTVNNDSVSALTGNLFSVNFFPYRESGLTGMVQTLKTASSGPSSDPAVASALATIFGFGNDFHSIVFNDLNSPGTALRMTVTVPGGDTGGGTIVPLPASVATGGSLLATLGLARWLRTRRTGR